MYQLLVPTDYSIASEIALRYACDFIKEKGGTLTIFNCRTQATGNLDHLKSYVKRFFDKLPGFDIEQFPIEYVVVGGTPEQSIPAQAQKASYDMIVMGTQGAGETQQQFGSTTAHVIRSVRCPVLAIPGDVVYRTIKKIVYALDYEADDTSSMKMLEDFAEKLDAEVILLHVNPYEHYFEEEKHQHYLKTMQDVSDYPKTRFEFVQNEHIGEAIEEFVQSHEVDLLAMLTHDYNLIEKAYDKSLTKEMLFQTQIPLLAFHE